MIFTVKNQKDEIVCEADNPSEAKRRAFMLAHFNKTDSFVVCEGDTPREQFDWQPLTKSVESITFSPVGGLSFS